MTYVRSCWLLCCTTSSYVKEGKGILQFPTHCYTTPRPLSREVMLPKRHAWQLGGSTCHTLDQTWWLIVFHNDIDNSNLIEIKSIVHSHDRYKTCSSCMLRMKQRRTCLHMSMYTYILAYKYEKIATCSSGIVECNKIPCAGNSPWNRGWAYIHAQCISVNTSKISCGAAVNMYTPSMSSNSSTNRWSTIAALYTTGMYMYICT